MGAKNLRRSLSPLRSELEALIWAMHCLLAQQKTMVIFKTDRSELVKMVYAPAESPTFSLFLEEFVRGKEYFSFFKIVLIPREQNLKADNLARSVHILPSYMIYVNYVPPIWINEPF